MSLVKPIGAFIMVFGYPCVTGLVPSRPEKLGKKMGMIMRSAGALSSSVPNDKEEPEQIETSEMNAFSAASWAADALDRGDLSEPALRDLTEEYSMLDQKLQDRLSHTKDVEKLSAAVARLDDTLLQKPAKETDEAPSSNTAKSTDNDNGNKGSSTQKAVAGQADKGGARVHDNYATPPRQLSEDGDPEITETSDLEAFSDASLAADALDRGEMSESDLRDLVKEYSMLDQKLQDRLSHTKDVEKLSAAVARLDDTLLQKPAKETDEAPSSDTAKSTDNDNGNKGSSTQKAVAGHADKGGARVHDNYATPPRQLSEDGDPEITETSDLEAFSDASLANKGSIGTNGKVANKGIIGTNGKGTIKTNGKVVK